MGGVQTPPYGKVSPKAAFLWRVSLSKGVKSQPKYGHCPNWGGGGSTPIHTFLRNFPKLLLNFKKN